MYIKTIIFVPLLLTLCAICGECACPNGFRNVAGECYVFSNKQPLQWDASRVFCQSLAPGADLASFSNCHEYDSVIKYILANGELQVPEGYSFWIGGSDRGIENSWSWVDLTPMPRGVPYWGSVQGVPEPSGGKLQNCAAMNRNDRYYIHDSECDQLAFPLCRVIPE